MSLYSFWRKQISLRPNFGSKIHRSNTIEFVRILRPTSSNECACQQVNNTSFVRAIVTYNLNRIFFSSTSNTGWWAGRRTEITNRTLRSRFAFKICAFRPVQRLPRIFPARLTISDVYQRAHLYDRRLGLLRNGGRVQNTIRTHARIDKTSIMCPLDLNSGLRPVCFLR